MAKCDSLRVFKAFVGLLVLVLLYASPARAVPTADQDEPLLFEAVPDPRNLGNAPAIVPGLAAVPDTPPNIDVWYGSNQSYGQLGNPQQWINILGNVSDANGIASLTYSLNGGPDKSLSVGPDYRRLVLAGDFNVDLDVADLSDGLNTVVIKARDTQGFQSSKTVNVQYESGNVWPRSYAIDWSSVTNILDVAQVVDGYWALYGGGLRTAVPGYDRLVAIGDLEWADYEITVPVTVHSTQWADPPGVGILMRWSGHTDDPVAGWQPKSGWFPLGAIGWYRWYADTPRLQLYGNQGRIIADDSSGWTLNMGSTYIFKLRVETNPGTGGYYSLKAWPATDPEPAGWSISGQEGLEDPQRGSLLLLAHRADVTFGDVTITPLGALYSVTVGVVGLGSVENRPGNPYVLNETATLEPVGDPGWSFSHWSGPNSGELVNNGDGTWSLTMTDDKAVTAHFVQDMYSVTVGIDGEGQVTHTPGNPYLYGEVATLEPIPDRGWVFGDWGGPDASDLTDNGDGTWSLSMDSSKSVTANFVPIEYTVAVDVSPSGTGQVDKDPDQATYHYEDEVVMTPKPEPGWEFRRWTGPDAGDMVDNGDDTWSLTVTGNMTVTAEFLVGQYEVDVTIDGKGSVRNEPGNPYLYDEVATLEPLPSAGWVFGGWGGPDAADLVSNGDGTWSLSMDDDKQVTAIYTTNTVYLPMVYRSH